MAKVSLHISISLDGFVAGPNQSEENPLGEGGEQLHEWALELAAWREPHGQEGGEVNASTEIIEEMREGVGATLMGRNMFGGGPGPWGEEPWEGWWGRGAAVRDAGLRAHASSPRAPRAWEDDLHLRHRGNPRLRWSRRRRQREAEDVVIGGGASAARQYLDAGLIDEINLTLVPVLLGSGARLFDEGAGAGAGLEVVRVVDAPGVTHLKYR